MLQHEERKDLAWICEEENTKVTIEKYWHGMHQAVVGKSQSGPQGPSSVYKGHTTPTTKLGKHAQIVSLTVQNRRSDVHVDGPVSAQTPLPRPIHGATTTTMGDGGIEIEDSYTDPVEGVQTLGSCLIGEVGQKRVVV